jgi:hypothetical protein
MAGNDAAIWSGIGVGVLGVGLGAAGLGMAVQANSDVNSLQTQVDGLREASVNLLEASAKLTLALKALTLDIDDKMTLSGGLLLNVNGIASVTSTNTLEANKVTCVGGSLGEIDGEQFVLTDVKTNANAIYVVQNNALQVLSASNITSITFPTNDFTPGTRVTIMNATGLDISTFVGVIATPATPLAGGTARDYIFIQTDTLSAWAEVI